MIFDVLRPIASALVRFAGYSAGAVLFGTVPLLLLVLRPSFDHLDDERWGIGRRRIAERLESIVRAMLVAGVVSTVLAIVLQAILVAEVLETDLGRDSFSSVFETSFGKWHLVRIALMLALAILVVGRVRAYGLERGRFRLPWWIIWGAVALAILATHSLSGHSSVANPRIFALVNDVLHMGTGSIWFAGIVVLAVVLPDAWVGFQPEERLHLLAPVVLRFSRVALVTILITGATGTINAFLHVGAFSDLWQTDYGRAVAGKIFLFGVILSVGAVNHFVLRTRFERALAEGTSTSAQVVFRKTIATELVIAIAILGLTGILVGQERTKDLPRTTDPSTTLEPASSGRKREASTHQVDPPPSSRQRPSEPLHVRPPSA